MAIMMPSINTGSQHYFRFQEIAGSLEGVLADPTDAILNLKPAPFAAAPAWATMAALRRCWSPDTLVAPLVHRFWKLSMQVKIIKYNNFN
jgi:hypothetical protein